MSQNLNWIGYKTIVRKEVTRILRIWAQTVVPPAITMTLYFIIFGNLIGRRIGEMGGFDYMQFIVPGLIMMSVITSSYGNIVSSFFGAKFGRHIEELLISPLPNWVILGGYVTGALFPWHYGRGGGDSCFAFLHPPGNPASVGNFLGIDHYFCCIRNGGYDQCHICAKI